MVVKAQTGFSVTSKDPCCLHCATLTLMCATGIRVSELVKLKLDELELERGYLFTKDKGKKERIVPIGEKARASMSYYLQKVRPELFGKLNSRFVFLGRAGRPLTRQIVWKNIKKYALAAGIVKILVRISCGTALR